MTTLHVRTALLAFLITEVLASVAWADTVAELQGRIEDKQHIFDERLAEYHGAVEMMTRYSGEVDGAEVAIRLKEDEVETALRALQKVLKFIEEHPDTSVSADKERNAYTATQEAYADARRSLNEKREREAIATGEATAIYVALQGCREELVNLHRQLANARFRKLQDELSQKKTVVVREELGCGDLTIRACKEGALERAKRSAVERGSAVLLESETVMEEVRVFLGSETEVQDRHVTRDWIASQVTGVLVGYNVLASGWVGETGYFYEIEAVIVGRISREFFDLMGDEDVPALPDSEQSADRAPAMQPEWTAEHGAGSRFRDCGECPELVVVPAGSFVIGSPAREVERMRSEGPRHTVAISYPLAVGVYEVTFEEWDACVDDRDCARYRPDDMRWGRRNRPVINVSWNDAMAYLDWLTKKTGHQYRLLSESEWEYVARASTVSPYYTGNTVSTDQANYDGNYMYGSEVSRMSREHTLPVGSFGANAFGVHDVHGNVWEWVEDCWNATYLGAPADGSAWRSGDCSRRVLRGGSWLDPPRFLRSANRTSSSAANRDVNIGFRVARTYRRFDWKEKARK